MYQEELIRTLRLVKNHLVFNDPDKSTVLSRIDSILRKRKRYYRQKRREIRHDKRNLRGR